MAFYSDTIESQVDNIKNGLEICLKNVVFFKIFLIGLI